MQKTIRFTLCSWLLFVCTVTSFATSYYVSTTGVASGPGSFINPWSFAYAIARPSGVVKPGDTIWVRGGTYIGQFTSTVSGTIDKPVVVRNYPNERVILRGTPVVGESEVTLTINGYSSSFIGLEFTSVTDNRISTGTADPPADIYTASGIYVFGEYTKIVNCIIHDCPSAGIGYWSSSLNAEVYGCLVFNNGYANVSRGHGPNMYVQNNNPLRPKAIRNSFLFNGFSGSIQFYAFADVLKGVIIDSSTVFNSGALAKPLHNRRPNLLAGGDNSGAGARIRNFIVTDNVFYRDTADNIYPPYMQYSSNRKNVELGYQDEALYDVDINFSRNHVFGDPTPVLLHRWDSGRFKNNTLYAYKNNYPGSRQIFEQEFDAAPFMNNWDSNYYYTNEPSYPTPFGDKTFENWKQTYHIDSNSTFVNTGPTANNNQVRRNRFEPHKYYVTIMNYLDADSVLLHINDTIHTNCSYAVFDVQNSWRVPVDTSIYTADGIKLKMNLTDVATPVGIVPSAPKHTGKTLGTFIIEFYPEVYTVKSGNWHDPTIWNTGKLPDYYNRIVINHPVTASQNAWCKSIKALNGQVTVAPGVLINVGQQ